MIERRQVRRQYRELLNDPEWKMFSHRYIAENPDCAFCDQPSFAPHHKHYRNVLPWEYGWNELVPVCKHCHDVIHSACDEIWNCAISLSPTEVELLAKMLHEIRTAENKQETLISFKRSVEERAGFTLAGLI